MKVDDVKLDPTNPMCPACKSKLVMNSASEGITHKGGIYNIPLICPECLFELWIQAMPCGCMIERQFADKLKDGNTP